VQDRSIDGPRGEVTLRVYRPQTTSSNLPLVLYVHGGGFFSGDLETHDPACRAISNQAQAVVVGVQYRLSPEYVYPAAAHDCYAALRWLATSGSTLGADSSRLFVVGDSAGGNLAAVLALMARDSGAPALAGQVLIYPMTDATFSFPSQVQNGLIPPFTVLDCVYAWQLYLPSNIDRRHPYISPVLAESFSGLAPALVITAGFDILADEGSAYAERLRQAGVQVEHAHYPEMVHGFFQWGGMVSEARFAMERVVQFLRQQASVTRSASRS
jgi:acetyl esterase